MFEHITAESVKADILARLSTTKLQQREGSFVNDIVSAVALEIAGAYHKMDALLPMFYLDETSGTYIDLQAAVVGITRRAGTKASCSITFTGEDGSTVPAGTPFYSRTGLAFALDEAVTITNGTVIGTATAIEIGTAGNIAEGELINTLRNYSGISSYTNSAASGGTDTETDESLLSRYLARMRRAPTSGNAYHYQSWAESVEGVGRSRVISRWDGPGTVQVVVAAPGMTIPDAKTVTAVAEYIEASRPVGAEVTVTAARAVPLAVEAAVTLDGSTDAQTVKNALSAAVSEYLQNLAKNAFDSNVDLQLEALENKSYKVPYNRIAFLMLSIEGVEDYTDLKLNGEAASVVIPADSVPVLTGVTVT